MLLNFNTPFVQKRRVSKFTHRYTYFVAGGILIIISCTQSLISYVTCEVEFVDGHTYMFTMRRRSKGVLASQENKINWAEYVYVVQKC